MAKNTPAGVMPAGGVVAYHVGGQGISIRDAISVWGYSGRGGFENPPRLALHSYATSGTTARNRLAATRANRFSMGASGNRFGTPPDGLTFMAYHVPALHRIEILLCKLLLDSLLRKASRISTGRIWPVGSVGRVQPVRSGTGRALAEGPSSKLIKRVKRFAPSDSAGRQSEEGRS